jgi:hypothetical protein
VPKITANHFLNNLEARFVFTTNLQDLSSDHSLFDIICVTCVSPDNIGYDILGFIALGVFMFVSHKYTVIAPVTLGIALFITSCSQTKVSQCQQLVRVVNEGTSLIDKNKGRQVITSIQLSKDLEFVTKSIKELNLTDPKLQEFQSGFVKIFQNLSQAIAKAGRALGVTKTAQASESGRERIQKARAEIDSTLTAAETIGKQSDTLVNKMNKYCSERE